MVKIRLYTLSHIFTKNVLAGFQLNLLQTKQTAWKIALTKLGIHSILGCVNFVYTSKTIHLMLSSQRLAHNQWLRSIVLKQCLESCKSDLLALWGFLIICNRLKTAIKFYISNRNRQSNWDKYWKNTILINNKFRFTSNNQTFSISWNN